MNAAATSSSSARRRPDERVKAWLRGLADGYILFDSADLFRKVEGPVVVDEVTYDQCLALGAGVETLGGLRLKPRLQDVRRPSVRDRTGHFELRKPYFVGQHALADVRVLSLSKAAPHRRVRMARAERCPAQAHPPVRRAPRARQAASSPSPAGRCRSGTPA